MRYILADGDDVGSRLELMLLDQDLESARRFSRDVLQAVEEAAGLVTALPGVDLIFIGGDGFLAALPEERLENVCEEMQTRFRQTCGCTLSIGLGPDARTATNALRRAKLLGKNRIVSAG